MNRFILAAATAATLLPLALSACATDPGDVPDDEADTDGGKADGTATSVRGFYFDQTAAVGDFASLTLYDDPTFDRLIQMVDCLPAPCQPEHGKFLFTHSSTHKYIRFTTTDGTLIDRYEYQSDGDGNLKLRNDGGSHWFSMVKSKLAGVEFELTNERSNSADLTAAQRAQLPASVVAAATVLKPLDTNTADDGPVTQLLTYQGDTFYTVSQYVENDDTTHDFLFNSAGTEIASGTTGDDTSSWDFDASMQTPANVASSN